MRAFVLDKQQQALMPCHPARARRLLSAGRAVVLRRYPFTIMLKDREGGDAQPISLNVDPGSKTTGIALVIEGTRERKALFGLHIEHLKKKGKTKNYTFHMTNNGMYQKVEDVKIEFKKGPYPSK